jgi:CHAD domain-containing protein
MGLLRQGAHPAVRRLLLERLDEAAQCAERLTNTGNHEALHDFRVALRRLNTIQRAYRAPLGIKRGKGVRRLARATNAARDREVQLDWLRQQWTEGDAAARAGLDTLIEKLERKHDAAREHDYPKWRTAYTKVAAKLRRRLERKHAADAGQESFARVAAPQLQALGDRLEQGLAMIETHDHHDNDGAVHAARITGKRLRYLLEPLAAEMPDVAPLIKRLKDLQDLLGEIHDCQVRLDHFTGRKQADRADQYAALQRATATRRAALLAELQTHWLGEQHDLLFAPLRLVILQLNGGSPSGNEAGHG